MIIRPPAPRCLSAINPPRRTFHPPAHAPARPPLSVPPSRARACVVVRTLVAAADQISIAPIQSKPYGKSYSAWAAHWWQWALQTPANRNPIFRDAACRNGQRGSVWFIGGTFDGSSVSRTCGVPANTALFLPLVNNLYAAFTNDPPETRTTQFIRSQVACTKTSATITRLRIDGHNVLNPTQYYEESIVFRVQLPANNVLGLTPAVAPGLQLIPSVDSGFYIFVNPLHRGHHTIEWTASLAPECTGSTQHVTYHITVGDEHDNRDDD